MTDGHRDSSTGERKLIWDEENVSILFSALTRMFPKPTFAP